MKARHVTTLENAPADFLIHGSAALQGYEADCFAMGLCLLHLLTGRAPYEELFADLTCPPELADALRAAWASAPEHDVTREHLEGDDDTGAVLADTLYRYVCMFGGLADGATRKRGASACAVWAALGAWHGTKAGRKAYARDAATWSVLTGKHEVCVHARRRMDALPGSAELLRGLVDFDPASRWTVEQALASEFFAPARERAGARAVDDGERALLSFSHYRDASATTADPPPPPARGRAAKRDDERNAKRAPPQYVSQYL